MIYSKKVLQHFRNPHNQGVIKKADAIGKVGNAVCGDVMKIYLKVNTPKSAKNAKVRQNINNMIIKDIKFETLGCAAAIAVTSALTVMVKGKTVERALAITKDDIVRDLGGLPAPKIHCSMLGVEALHEAIENYKVRSESSYAKATGDKK